jgi:hypothetical protein
MSTQQRPLEFRAYHALTHSLFSVLYFTEYEVFRTPNHAYWIDECILMQFTGLYDSQGTKIFEGDVLYSYFPGCGGEPSREYWRLIAYRAGGFCELSSLGEELVDPERFVLSNYQAAQRGDYLPDRVVDCYYLQPNLLNLNTETGLVPTQFA